MTLAVMGCVVNGPGESKAANIGISLPGTGEAPNCPVFIDGQHCTTLRGTYDELAAGVPRARRQLRRDEIPAQDAAELARRVSRSGSPARTLLVQLLALFPIGLVECGRAVGVRAAAVGAVGRFDGRSRLADRVRRGVALALGCVLFLRLPSVVGASDQPCLAS